MSLNIRKGDMYKFIDFTWNPIKGKCLHDCSYCYMKQINPNANLPRLAEHELNTYLGYGRSIFIGSSTDMFAEIYHPNGLKGCWIIVIRIVTWNNQTLICCSPRTPRDFWNLSIIRL